MEALDFPLLQVLDIDLIVFSFSIDESEIVEWNYVLHTYYMYVVEQQQTPHVTVTGLK